MSPRCCQFGLFASFYYDQPACIAMYTLSLHDALPIYRTEEELTGEARLPEGGGGLTYDGGERRPGGVAAHPEADRKSTRLNSSHQIISYAVFCLKKKW